MPAWSRLARHQGGQAYFHPRVCAEVFSPSDRVQRAPWGSGRCTSWRIAEIHRLSKKGGVEKLNRFAYILPRQLVQDEPSRTPTAYCLDSCLGVSWFFALWPFVGRDWNVTAGSPAFFLPQLTPRRSTNRI